MSDNPFEATQVDLEPGSDAVSLTVSFEEKDALAYFWFFHLRDARLVASPASRIIVLGFGILCFLLSWQLSTIPDVEFEGILAVFLVGLIFVVVPLITTGIKVRHFNRFWDTPTQVDPVVIEYRADDKGIWIDEGVWEWGHIRSLNHTPDYMFVDFSNGGWVAVPKNQVEPKLLAAFESKVRERMNVHVQLTTKQQAVAMIVAVMGVSLLVSTKFFYILPLIGMGNYPGPMGLVLIIIGPLALIPIFFIGSMSGTKDMFARSVWPFTLVFGVIMSFLSLGLMKSAGVESLALPALVLTMHFIYGMVIHGFVWKWRSRVDVWHIGPPPTYPARPFSMTLLLTIRPNLKSQHKQMSAAAS